MKRMVCIKMSILGGWFGWILDASTIIIFIPSRRYIVINLGLSYYPPPPPPKPPGLSFRLTGCPWNKWTLKSTQMILETVCEYFLLKKCKLHSINIKVELENYNKVSRMMMSRFGPISDIVSISGIVRYLLSLYYYRSLNITSLGRIVLWPDIKH